MQRKENEKRQIESTKCIGRLVLGCKSLEINMPIENGEMWKEKCTRVVDIDLAVDAFAWSRMQKKKNAFVFFSLIFFHCGTDRATHVPHITHGQHSELSCFSSLIRHLYPIHVVATHSFLIFTWKLLFTLFEIIWSASQHFNLRRWKLQRRHWKWNYRSVKRKYHYY